MAKDSIGVALDIGTTTIAALSVDMASGRTLGTASAPNPQARWGRDLISRVNAIVGDPALLGELSACVLSACDKIIREVGEGRALREIVAAGNTVMEHILLNVSPEPMARVPYRPAFKDARRLLAKEAGFDVGAEVLLYTFPLIGGFVGGDAVAVALALAMDSTDKTVLAVDIGTNSEIILSVKGSLLAASAAAGPAFEAGELSSGMTAGRGAIQGIEIRGDNVVLDVIGGVAPKGVCGSGLVAAVSALVHAGVIEPSGRIKDQGEIETNLSARIKSEGGENRFVLFRGAGGEVSFTQADIRALQVAKSAIRAGVSVLLKKAGLSSGDIDAVYIAGAFGSKLDKDGLCTIGLIDDDWVEKIEFVGDAVLKGAALALSDPVKSRAEALARNVRYVSLSGSAHFEAEFMRNMNFNPHKGV
jgi:uncharacterized 2Fe-2S/4Fe-4S cluster protein (DUF4445 family)